MASAAGPWLTDVDGRRYVDLIGSWGPMILGHAHPSVVEAVRETADAAASRSAHRPRTRSRWPRRSSPRTPVEQVRLVNSGTEATMTAIRLARGYTGRSVVVKFAGCYHGHVDSLLAAAGSGVATFGLPDSAGGAGVRGGRDDRAALQRPRRGRGGVRRTRRRDRLRHHRGRRRQHGRRPAGRRASPRGSSGLPHAHGALLVSDEVMTGFRCSPSGWYGLEGPYASGPRTCSPSARSWVAAFPRRLSAVALTSWPCSPRPGPVYQAGTLSGNPVATAAGLATLRGCTPEVYERLDVVSRAIAEGVSEGLGREAVSRIPCSGRARCSASSSARGRCANYDDARAQSTEAFAAFFHAMLSQGVHLPPSSFEAWFVSAAHDDEAVDHVLAVGAGRAAGPRPAGLRQSTHEPPGHRRAPDAARRGAQPGGDPLRPPAGVPAVRAGPRDGRDGGPAPRGARRGPGGGLSAGAGPGDRGAHRGHVRPAGGRPTTGSSRPATTSRARRSGSATAPCRSPRSGRACCNPFTP